MASKKEHLLMIALGKGRKAPPPADDIEDDDDGLEHGADDDSDEGQEPDEDEDDSDYSDEDSIGCAHDLMDALDKGDAQGIVDAIKAIAGK